MTILIRLILLFFLINTSVFAGGWYSNSTDAQNACNALIGSKFSFTQGGTQYNVDRCVTSGGGFNTSICNSNGQYFDYHPYNNSTTYFHPTETFHYCNSGTQSCPVTGQVRNESGACVCPSGTYYNGLGSCITKPVNCTLKDYNAVNDGCPLESSVGWSQHTCWDNSSNSVLSVQACSPNCGPSEHVENYSCVSNETCIGDQVYNYSTNHCDEPVCNLGQQTLDAEKHVCVDPNCLAGQLLCSHVCYLATDCATGYLYLCDGSDSTALPHCQFNGCPSGFVQGMKDGVNVCIKNSVISGTVSNNTSSTTSGSSSTTSSTVVNSDGSITTTSVGDSQTTIVNNSTTDISLDTSGLAQESTLSSVLDALNDFFGSESDFSNASDMSPLDGIGGDSDDSDAIAFLNNGNDSYAYPLNVSDWMPEFPTNSSCSGSVPIVWGNFSYQFSPCEKLQPLREVLAWVFYVLSFWNIFRIWVSIKE
ncbi:hypothetical protein [Methylomicrobium lacus]|uniref:hypothetical protein n=1 Tax=Methylomicrobium lacus TaxID=136992 RepID=UPI0035A8DB1F